MSHREPDGYRAPTYHRPHVDNWGDFKKMLTPTAESRAIADSVRALRIINGRTLLPRLAIDAIAEMMEEMTRTGRHARDAWRLMTVSGHLSHAHAHVYKHHQGDASEDHLLHAACRLLMALEQRLVQDQPEPLTVDHVRIDASVFDDDGEPE